MIYTLAPRPGSAVIAGTSFRDMRGILKPPSLDSRTPTAVIGKRQRYFLIGVGHSTALLQATVSLVVPFISTRSVPKHLSLFLHEKILLFQSPKKGKEQHRGPMSNNSILQEKIYSTFWRRITYLAETTLDSRPNHIKRIGALMRSTLALDQSVIRLHWDLLSSFDLLSFPLLLSIPPLRKYSSE